MPKVNCCSSFSKMKVILSLMLFLQIGGLSAERSVQAELEELCAKNGGLKALGDSRIVLSNMQQCFESIGAELNSEVQKTGGTESVVGLFCSKIENMKGCISPYVASFKPCFKKDQYEVVESSHKVSIAALQWVCDNSEDIREALSSKDINCLTAKMNNLKGCLDQMIDSFDAIKGQQSALNLTNESAIFGNGSKVCSGLHGFQQCSVNALKQCEDKKFATLLDSMYKHVNNEIPCVNLPKSKASTTSVHSFLILIVPLVFINL